jgi:hypothetical protein
MSGNDGIDFLSAAFGIGRKSSSEKKPNDCTSSVEQNNPKLAKVISK